jgi:stage II sporulation protein R
MKTTAEPKRKLYIFEIALLFGIVLFLVSGVFALQTQDALAEKVVRLHVLANSDSQEDQALKLQVRNVVLAHAEQLLLQTSDRQEAESVLRGQLLELERLAGKTVAEAGYDYPVSVELADTEFPTRQYDGFTLPAGEYLALRVLIGAAEGQNWWCVVFPPLCTAASAEIPAAALAAGLEQEEIRLITEDSTSYVLKFKVVEFWQGLRQRLDEN